MTRRQWMWLWIWLLLFFILFCVWDKTQTLATGKNNVDQSSKSTAAITQTPSTVSKEEILGKDINLKIVKDDTEIKISGVFPSKEALETLKTSYKKIGDVQEGVIIIDKNANNSQVTALMPTLTEDFAKFKSGYLEYNDGQMIIDGIVSDENIKKSIADKALLAGNLTLDNRVILESESEKSLEENSTVEKRSKEQNNTVDSKAAQLQTKEISNELLQEKLNALLNEQKVEFVYGKATLTKKGKQRINDAYEILAKHAKVKVEVGGHTDSDGKRVNNKKLSQRRADAIVSYLVKKGLKRENLKAVGYGESKPLVKNDSLKNKQINRRVEFKIIGE